MIAVIADDFTGAAEVAGICLRYGVSVNMLTDIPDAELLRKQSAQVVVLAVDTRSFTAEGARKVSAILARNLLEAGVEEVIKKIDSVLRGWVLIEMSTLASILGKTSLLIAPANPATHRSVRKGQCWVGNQLLHQTAFADDPDFPAHSSNLSQLLTDRLAELPIESLPFEVPDAENFADLRRLATTCPTTCLPGGSAGFWQEYLLARLETGQLIPSLCIDLENEQPSLEDSLIVCGSAHENSVRFSDAMEAKYFPVAKLPRDLLGEERPSDELSMAWVKDCAETWQSHRRLLVRVASQRIVFDYSAERLRFRLTELLGELLQHIQPTHLFLEGGATACSLLQRLSWSSFTPIREWSPGVVQLRLNEPPYCDITLKPGSYDWPAFLRSSY